MGWHGVAPLGLWLTRATSGGEVDSRSILCNAGALYEAFSKTTVSFNLCLNRVLNPAPPSAPSNTRIQANPTGAGCKSQTQLHERRNAA